VASHGLTHLNRWAAGLVLQGSSLGAATLTTSRILAEGTFSSVDLVILNACRTGTHEGTGRTVQTLRSLESAFLARGAKAVVSTLWEITDLQGVVFSAVLHAYLGAGVDPHTAFTDTTRYLRAGQWQWFFEGGPLLSAESAIDSVLPDWRSHLDQQAAENPLFWAAFKITGAV
jgi:CHAT domain-containing protein